MVHTHTLPIFEIQISGQIDLELAGQVFCPLKIIIIKNYKLPGLYMTDFQEDKNTIMKDMTRTLTSKFMDYASGRCVFGDIDEVEDMVGYLAEDNEVWDHYSDMIRECIDDFVHYRLNCWDLLSVAVDNCSREMNDIAEDILDDMYDLVDDEYGSDDLKPSKVIPRWAYCILREEVGISDIFKELFEKEDEIISGITSLQAIMRGRSIRWRYPLFAMMQED